jgi:hypothetical protein
MLRAQLKPSSLMGASRPAHHVVTLGETARLPASKWKENFAPAAKPNAYLVACKNSGEVPHVAGYAFIV